MLTFHRMLKELRQQSSANAKKEILENYEECQEQLNYALNSFMMYGVTSKKIDTSNPGQKNVTWPEVQILLNKLHKRKLTGHAAIDAINELLHGAREELIETFPLFLDKDLKAGVGIALINKVFPKLIETFEVQLCRKWEDPEKLPYERTFASRKLDGLRCIAIRENKKFRFFSRAGKEFTTLDVLKKDLEEYYKNDTFDFVLDGEICSVDENGNENFTKAISEVKRKDYTMKKPMLKIFDFLLLKEFKEGRSLYPFCMRYDKMVQDIKPQKTFEVLEQIELTDPSQLDDLYKLAQKNDWEGLILKDGESTYENKRTKTMYKLKKFHDHEFIITGCEEGTGKFEGILGAFVVEGEYKNKKIVSKVGSGFGQKFNYFRDGVKLTDEEVKEVREHNSTLEDMDDENYIHLTSKPDPDGDRVKLWKQRNKLMGQVMTVQFFEMSKNKDGEHSLRFPVMKHIHGEQRTV